MAETTQAQAPVEKGTDDASILRRMAAVVEDNPAEGEPEPDTKPREPAPAQQQAEPAEPDAAEAKPTDPAELTADDLPDDAVATPPVAEDTFEIVHDGKQVKLTREETISLARQGFDYTQKTQAVAEKAKAVEAALKLAQEAEQIMPLIANEQAQFVAMQTQLAQWKDVDWVRLATEQPTEYPKYRAQFDLIKDGVNQAAQRLNQAITTVQSQRQQASVAALRQQFDKLTNEYVPEWKDPAKYEQGSRELSQYLVKEGVPPEQVATLSDAVAVKIALKAMKYDALLASKQNKSKLLQTKPPVTRPGTPITSKSAEADKEQQAQKRLRKTGSIEDAAALYMLRLK